MCPRFGADVVIGDARTGRVLDVLDLKTHGGVKNPIGAGRQAEFFERFGMKAKEVNRAR